MDKRLIPLLLVIVGLAACGSDAESQSSPNSESTLPPVATDVLGEISHSSGADDVVISYGEFGGFVPREFAFQQTPNVLISGDGRVFSPGAQIEIYPGPLLPAVQVQTITEEGVQRVLAAAEASGLFADIAYDEVSNVADAATATVTITADDATWTHEAYALGFGDGADSTPARKALLDFVTTLGDLTTLVGPGNLGEESIFDPEQYAIEAVPVEDLSAYGSDGIDPTVVEWPADASVRLADAASCTVVPATEVGDTLGAANQLTFFSDAGVTYQLFARPVIPGSTCTA